MSKRFVARSELSLGEVLAAMTVDVVAIAEGRVFCGPRRAQRVDERVRTGEEVQVHDAPAAIVLPDPFVLHHERGILVVDKPAGISTIPDVMTARGTLVDLAARAVSISRDKLHPTSRLDREVSGVVTFALDERARDALQRARDAGLYARRYLAIATGEAAPGPWQWAIGRARDPKLRRADPSGKPAETRVRIVARAGAFSLLALAPVTGRTHQIRVHAAAAGAPLVGDRAYGGPTRLTLPSGKSVSVGRIALHCARVRISAPDCIMSAVSPVPPELVELARAVGLATHLEEAIACEV